jgi:hypothetical protein
MSLAIDNLGHLLSEAMRIYLGYALVGFSIALMGYAAFRMFKSYRQKTE